MVNPLDLAQGSGSGTIVRDELCSDRERLGGVQGAPRGPVIREALAKGIESTAALVTIAAIV